MSKASLYSVLQPSVEGSTEGKAHGVFPNVDPDTGGQQNT